MINLKIDPEFQNQIPPLTDDEFKQLEENILKEGKLLSPLIVWGNTLVDGHNRYAILQKHPEIYFSTMPLPFESREEVLAWICKNQLGRRNLSPEQKRYLLGKQYEAEKKAAKIFQGNQYTLAKKSGGDHGDNHHSGKKTCDRIAEENGVSRASVLRASHYTRGIDIADNRSPDIKQKVLRFAMQRPALYLNELEACMEQRGRATVTCRGEAPPSANARPQRGPIPNPVHGSHLTVRTAMACRAYITSPRSYRTDRRYNDQNECSTDP